MLRLCAFVFQVCGAVAVFPRGGGRGRWRGGPCLLVDGLGAADVDLDFGQHLLVVLMSATVKCTHTNVLRNEKGAEKLVPNDCLTCNKDFRS